jgi:hypothetical protein
VLLQGLELLVTVLLARNRLPPPTVAAGVLHAELAAELISLPSGLLAMVCEAIVKLKVRLGRCLACVWAALAMGEGRLWALTGAQSWIGAALTTSLEVVKPYTVGSTTRSSRIMMLFRPPSRERCGERTCLTWRSSAVEWRHLDCSEALGGDAIARCERVFVVAAGVRMRPSAAWSSTRFGFDSWLKQQVPLGCVGRPDTSPLGLRLGIGLTSRS